MTPNDFLRQLNNLPPDTPITAHHLISILSILSNDTIEKAEEKPFSSLGREDLITEEQLATWINKNVQTLRNWRVDGKGPKFIKDSRTVNYRVGTVIDWLKSREVQSTTQADMLKFGSTTYNSVFPSLYINHVATPFFETIRDNEDDYAEMNFTGYQTLWTEEDSLASLYLENYQLNTPADDIVEEFLQHKNNGCDLNGLETILINNQAHSINLTHLIALNPLEHEQYTVLVRDLYEQGLNFHTKDGNGKTSINLAEENDNNHLVSMIKSFDLYISLQNKLNKH